MSQSANVMELFEPLPEVVDPGFGVRLMVAGRAPGRRVVALRVAGEAWEPTELSGVGPSATFCGFVTLRAAPHGNGWPVEADVADGGGGSRVVAVGAVRRVGSVSPPVAEPMPAGAVAICLPVFEPDPELFAAQVASLRDQTHSGWSCVVVDDASSAAGRATIAAVIADDARFRVQRFEQRVGVYRNVERGLELLPDGVAFVALCDQDDVWNPAKLARMVAVLQARPDAQLVHCDMQIVSRAGALIAPTAWTDRVRSEDRLRDLVAANTVTGAAALLRAEVVRCALPFPQPIGPDAFHDHWLALVARVRGAIAFADEPLMDYVQHERNVLGHRSGHVERSSAARQERWRASYIDHLLWRKTLAALLLLRFGASLSARDRRELERTAAGTGAPAALVVRAVTGAFRRRRTLNNEWRVLRGALWHASLRFPAAARREPDLTLLEFAAPGGPAPGPAAET